MTDYISRFCYREWIMSIIGHGRLIPNIFYRQEDGRERTAALGTMAPDKNTRAAATMGNGLLIFGL
jgi:hypothetical protein